MDTQSRVDFNSDPGTQKAKLMLEALHRAAAATGWRTMSSCLSADLLFYYVGARIPKNDQGAVLKEKILNHLILCKQCRTRTRAATKSLIAVTPIVLHDDNLRKEQLHKIESLIKALVLYARSRPLRPAAATAPQKRFRAFGQELNGYVLQEFGKLKLETDGQPCMVKFSVTRAKIDRSGRFTLDLKTSDNKYCEQKDSTFEVRASIKIEKEDTVLILPPNKIYENGQVTINAKIQIQQEVKFVPLEAIKLVVYRAGTNLEPE